jgi:hypothetical protein
LLRLRDAGIEVLDFCELGSMQARWLRDRFEREILPVLAR